MLITVTKKVSVPEEDIEEVIKVVKEWFERNPDRLLCNPSIFGHHVWQVRKERIEEDVRLCAAEALPYSKK